MLNKKNMPWTTAPCQLDAMVLSRVPNSRVLIRKKLLVWLLSLIIIFFWYYLYDKNFGFDNHLTDAESQLAQQEIDDAINQIDNVMVLAQQEDDFKIDQINDF